MSGNLAQYIQFTSSGLPQGMSASMSGFNSPDEANAAVTAANQTPVRDFAAEQAAALSAALKQTSADTSAGANVALNQPNTAPTDISTNNASTAVANAANLGTMFNNAVDSGFNVTPTLIETNEEHAARMAAEEQATKDAYDAQWRAAHPSSGGGGLFGGGGNFFSDIGNSFSNAFSGLGNALASIDPGPAIGQGLAESDKFINREIPGGYVLPVALGIAATTGYVDPSLFTSTAAEGVGTGAAAGATTGAAAGTAAQVGTIATEIGQQAFFDALASGATSAEAIDAGLAAQSAIAGTTGAELASGSLTAPSSYVSPSQALTADVSGATTGSGTGMTFGSTGASGGIIAPTGSAIAVDPAILAASGAELPAYGTTATGAAMGAGTSGVGGLNPALPAAGATETGTLSAALAPNTVLGTGLEGGGAIGASYQLGANGLPATNIFGNPVEGSSVGLNGSTAIPTTVSTSDINNAKNIAKLLTSSAGQKLTNAAQNLATGQTGVGSAIPALLRGNQNPFLQTAQQPIRSNSNLASLAQLLKQG